MKDSLHICVCDSNGPEVTKPVMDCVTIGASVVLFYFFFVCFFCFFVKWW